MRDANGELLVNRHIALRISMHVGSADGPIAYMEVDTTTTSPNGIFSVVVGGGSIMQGDFNLIPWTGGQIYQQVELDENGGDRFTDMGTAQLLSLPYAIAAGNGVKEVNYDETGKLMVTSADGSESIATSRATWMAGGNASITADDFIGTTDDADVVFKRNNAETMRLAAGNSVTMPGKLGLGGVASPAVSLDVSGAMAIRETTVNVSGTFNLNVGNNSLIFVNSSVPASYATAILGPGAVKGQILMISVTGTYSNYGIKFVNNSNYNTRISANGNGISSSSYASKTYTDGNTITFLWNGNDWVQIASSYGE